MLCPLYECPSTIFNQYVVFLEESSASSVRALPVEIKCPHSSETESTGFCDGPSQIGAEQGTSVCVPRYFQNLNGDVQHNYWHKMVGFEKFHFSVGSMGFLWHLRKGFVGEGKQSNQR